MKKKLDHPNLVKIGQEYLEFYTKTPKYILLLPAIINDHKVAQFECNGIMLLEQPRR